MTSHRRSESGFTLVEMLIAMAVMSLVIVAFYALITTLVRQWASMQGQMEVQQQPRVAAGRIMAEIRQSRDFVIGSGGDRPGPGILARAIPDRGAGGPRVSVRGNPIPPPAPRRETVLVPLFLLATHRFTRR